MRNPLTDVLDEAQTLIEAMESSIIAQYGQALFTESKVEWPKDPEAMSPEEMAQLVQVHGMDSVNQFLAEHYQSKADAAQYLGEE